MSFGRLHTRDMLAIGVEDVGQFKLVFGVWRPSSVSVVLKEWKPAAPTRSESSLEESEEKAGASQLYL